MSSARILSVKSRTGLGTGEARQERRSGFVPAVVYGGKESPSILSVEERLLRKELQEPGIFSHLYTIEVSGKKQHVLIRDIQFHPVTDRPVHVDFLRVDTSSAIHVDVPLVFLHEEKCPGLKAGGVLNTLRHALHVSCSPIHIPEKIEIDLDGKEIGYSCHIQDIVLPQGVTLSHLEKADTIFSIVPPKVKEEETEEASASEPEEKTESAPGQQD